MELNHKLKHYVFNGLESGVLEKVNVSIQPLFWRFGQ